jgi:hypothetical protein
MYSPDIGPASARPQSVDQPSRPILQRQGTCFERLDGPLKGFGTFDWWCADDARGCGITIYL